VTKTLQKLSKPSRKAIVSLICGSNVALSVSRDTTNANHYTEDDRVELLGYL